MVLQQDARTVTRPMPRKTVLIFSLAVLVGLAVPATLAHTEDNPDACDDKQGKECIPQGNHDACTGTRDWRKSGQDGSDYMRVIQIEDSEDEISVYAKKNLIEEGDDEDESENGEENETLLNTPGLLYVETNGFSGLQKSDWQCTSPHHEDPEEWVKHPDKVIL